MSFTKEIKIGQIEIVADWSIQVRTDTIVKENNVEISRSYHRHVLQPFTSTYKTKEVDGVLVPDLDKDDKVQWIHTDTDISSENDTVKAVCNAVWSDDIKAQYKTYKEANSEV